MRQGRIDHLRFYAADSLAAARQLASGRTNRISRRRTAFRFLDTHDFRLLRAGMTLGISGRAGALRLDLHRLDGERWLAGADCVSSPRWSSDLPDGRYWDEAARVIYPRALLSVLFLNGDIEQHDLRDDEQKLVARLTIEAFTVRSGLRGAAHALPLRLLVAPLRGYGGKAEKLLDGIGMTPAEPLPVAAMKALGRDPDDQGNARPPVLRPDMTACEAALLIIAHQFATMRLREDGIRADIDSEFLHEYRVALRRMRSALSAFRVHLPPDLHDAFAVEAKILGDATTPLRDLDVMLLAMPGWRSSLPPGIAASLGSVADFLVRRRREALAGLRRKLGSAGYRDRIHRLDQQLNDARQAPAVSEPVDISFADFARTGIEKAVRRLLRDGERITTDSPPEALHDLRKRGKKLRYLIEFTTDLHDSAASGAALKSLRSLQDILGQFQDSAIAIAQMEAVARAMDATGALPIDSALALGRLIAGIDALGARARKRFESRFTEFRDAVGKSPARWLDGK